jgi:hypothetical protein
MTAVLALRAVFNYATGKKLGQYLEEAKAKGIPLTMRDVAPRCPDSDNAAPFWKAAEALFVLPEQKDRKLAGDAIGAYFDGRTFDNAARNTLIQWNEKNRKVFELIAEASARPCFQYGDWTKAPWSIEQIKAIKTIQAIRLLGIDSVLQAEAGQVQKGLEECRHGMSFVRKLMDEPWLLNNLVALAEMKALLICFNRIASGRDIDLRALPEWINELNPQSWRTRFDRWVECERIIILEFGLGRIRGNEDVLTSESKGDRLLYWLIRPLLKSQLIWVQDQYRELGKSASSPYYAIKGLLKEHGRSPESIPWYYRLSGLLFADFQSVFLKESTLEAMMLATRAGLACKIYRNKTGHYPENLEALVPDILTEVPIDPFTGKPLVYKIENGELLIYSLGSNEKDDGGRGTYLITQLVMEKDDDWTWREKIR